MFNQYATSIDIKQISDIQVLWHDKILPCKVGHNGFSSNKQEGDGCTPTGIWKPLNVYYRADRIPKPTTVLPVVEIMPDMGWSDDPKDPFYNSCITRPYPFSHEELWRNDNLYDVFISTSHNTNPPIPGEGSAIFIHRMRESMVPTAGCLALKFEDLLYFIETLTFDTRWIVSNELG